MLLLPVLKAVENLGVSYVKTTEQYKNKLHTEFSGLGFPHREEAVRTCARVFFPVRDNGYKHKLNFWSQNIYSVFNNNQSINNSKLLFAL